MFYCFDFAMCVLLFAMILSCGGQNTLNISVLSHVFFCCLIWFNYLMYWFAPISQVSVVKIHSLFAFIFVFMNFIEHACC